MSAGGSALGATGRTGLAHAAMSTQVGQQIVHLPEGRSIVKMATFPLGAHQVGMDQFLQMERECRGRNVEHRRQRARCHACRTRTHQRAEDSQPGLLRQGGECSDSAFFIHDSKFIEILGGVKLSFAPIGAQVRRPVDPAREVRSRSRSRSRRCGGRDGRRQVLGYALSAIRSRTGARARHPAGGWPGRSWAAPVHAEGPGAAAR